MATTNQGINTNELFKSYQKDDIMKAQLIAKNLFCKEPGDIKVFNSYFSFCTGVISKKPVNSIETCQFFFSEAELALRIFSEKCEMSEESLKAINNSNEILQKKLNIINSMIDDVQKQAEAEAVSANNQIFNDLCGMIIRLECYYSDKVADEIAELDNKLNKDLLSKAQIKHYKAQSEKLSGVIAKRIREQNVAYNKKALEAFKVALEQFIGDSSYKKDKERDRLRGLLKSQLFDYKQELLFPETMVYYNYVYSYIFSKLDNDGKRDMTECAIYNKK